MVVKKVGNLKLLVRASPHSKPILVHVDRVKHANRNDQLVKFDPEKGQDRPFSDPPVEEDLDLPVQHYSPEAVFGAYMESASESENKSATGEQAEEADKGAQPARKGQPALPVFPDMPERRVTRGAARDFGVGKFAVYKHDSLLFLLDGRLVKVKGESSMVAVSSNKDEFFEVSGSDLHSCLHIGSVFSCHYLGVKISSSFPCCLCDIFTGKTNEVMRDCELTFLSARFWLDAINSTSFMYFPNSSLCCAYNNNYTRALYVVD